jgi:hypothetical protein
VASASERVSASDMENSSAETQGRLALAVVRLQLVTIASARSADEESRGGAWP